MYEQKEPMATVEEPEQHSSKPFIDIWQCMTEPLCRVAARTTHVINAALTWSILVGGDYTELDFW